MIHDNIDQFEHNLKKESEYLLVNKYLDFIKKFEENLKNDNNLDRFLFFPNENKNV